MKFPIISYQMFLFGKQIAFGNKQRQFHSWIELMSGNKERYPDRWIILIIRRFCRYSPGCHRQRNEVPARCAFVCRLFSLKWTGCFYFFLPGFSWQPPPVPKGKYWHKSWHKKGPDWPVPLLPTTLLLLYILYTPAETSHLNLFESGVLPYFVLSNPSYLN